MRSFAFAAIAAFAAAAEEQENLYHTYGPHYYGRDVTPYEYTHGPYQHHESRYPAYAHAAYVAADHSAHRVLQHKFDDAHDVTPVPYHEHAVLKAVDRPESRSYESMPFRANQNGAEEKDNYYHYATHVSPYHGYAAYGAHPAYHGVAAYHYPATAAYHYPAHAGYHYPAYATHHAYVGTHGSPYYGKDVTPYEYTHGRYQHQESRYPAYAHAAYVAADHSAHRVLEHKYDDAHDVTPVDFHEHAVLKAVDRPESHSYEHMAIHDGLPAQSQVADSIDDQSNYRPVYSVQHGDWHAYDGYGKVGYGGPVPPAAVPVGDYGYGEHQTYFLQ